MSACRIAVGFVLALLAGPVMAQDAKLGDLVVVAPWARATIGQVKNGAAYLTVANHGAAADRLLAVSTPVAAQAELHGHTMQDGVMKMRPVEAIEIGPMQATALQPGGHHVMLMGLENPLVEGATFLLTLTFETAGSLEVEVRVQGIAAMGPGEGQGHAGHDAEAGSHSMGSD